MTPFEQVTDTFPSIATREELLRRLAESRMPVRETGPRLPGIDGEAVYRQSAQANEKRIEKLQRDLGHASDRFGTEFTFNKLEGRARAAFDRDR